VRPVEEHAGGRPGRVAPVEPGIDRGGRQIGMVEALARLRSRRVVPEAGRQQMVGQEAQAVLDVVEAAEPQIGQRLVGDRHADRR
jgi:hypothetical protein